MTQREFDQLSEKYLRGACTPEELRLLESWHQAQLNAASPPDLFANEQTLQRTEKRLWRRIHSSAQLGRHGIQRAIYWPWVAGVAATVLLVFGYFYWSKTNAWDVSHATAQQQGIESINTSEHRQKLVLPDGSTVVLEKNASIVVAEHYGRRMRKVFLQGEAFFEVRRNTKAPFLVFAEGLITEVLGTSFRIKPQSAQKTIEVSVKSGRVSVYTTQTLPNKQRNGLILTPNQKGIFHVESHSIQQAIVDTPQILIPNLKPADFQFENSPLEQIARTMQLAYGIELVLPNDKIRSCKFTGNLNGLGLQKQLDLLCGSFNIAYEIRGTTVFILGDHCE